MVSCDATSVSSSLKGNNQYWVREAGSHMGKKPLKVQIITVFELHFIWAL